MLLKFLSLISKANDKTTITSIYNQISYVACNLILNYKTSLFTVASLILNFGIINVVIWCFKELLILTQEKNLSRR